jgi:triacylglycerol esterase/lipase EstA (alpha/beta hydrolase family)
MSSVVRAAAVALAAAGLPAGPAGASAPEPRLTVPPARLAAAVTCHGDLRKDGAPPVVFAPGTWSDGSQVYALGRGAFEALRRPLCVVSFPDRATADLQVSVQYLVHAIRAAARRAGQPVDVAGASQGGVLARLALTVWPSLRAQVDDVVTVAAPHHGARGSLDVCARKGCPPAIWQQARGSHLLDALNNGGDETPGPASWTTVRSASDDVVQPQTGAHPTSALEGAENVLIQDVCPGRRTTHLATVVDSVTIAALRDAIGHDGPARRSRLPADVCAHPYGTGLDEQQTAQFLALAPGMLRRQGARVRRVRREPEVRAWLARALERHARTARATPPPITRPRMPPGAGSPASDRIVGATS